MVSEKYFMGHSYEKLKELGYAPTGKPGLMTNSSITIRSIDLEKVVREANPDIPNLSPEAYSLYIKSKKLQKHTDKSCNIYEIIGYASDSEYFIVQPLKKINTNKFEKIRIK